MCFSNKKIYLKILIVSKKTNMIETQKYDKSCRKTKPWNSKLRNNMVVFVILNKQVCLLYKNSM